MKRLVLAWMAALCLSAPGAVVWAQGAGERPLLTLEQALEAARANHPEIREGRSEVMASEARSDQALSPLLPQLSANAGYELSTNNSPPIEGPGGVTIEQDTELGSRFSFSFTATQLIYDFGQSLNRRRSSLVLVTAQRDDERVRLLTVSTNVRLAYYTAGAARALVQVAEETLANQERHLEQIEAFVGAGSRPEIDLYQARAEVANARLQLIDANNGYELAKVELNQAMGIESDTAYDVSLAAGMAPLPGEDSGSESLREEALEARPELAVMESQMTSSELLIESTEGGQWPTLSVSTGLSETGSALDEMAWNWFIGLNLTWRFYQGGLVSAQIREAQTRVVTLEAQRDLLRQAIVTEVERARLELERAKAAVIATDELVANAGERLRLAEGRYETGVGNALELNDAQVALSQAQVQLVQAQFDVATARVLLMAALGRP